MVRCAVKQLVQLYPQVTNAARILVGRPTSKVAQENMEVFRLACQQQLAILTDAVDDIIAIEDFLAVSENQILEDVNRCCLALQEGDADLLAQVRYRDMSVQLKQHKCSRSTDNCKHDKTFKFPTMQVAAELGSRTGRLAGVVGAELDSWGPGQDREEVVAAVRELQTIALPQFSANVQVALVGLGTGADTISEENKFIGQL